MYIANKSLKVQRLGPKGEKMVVQVKPGDPLPEADSWNERVIRAHLKLRHIRGATVEEMAKFGKASEKPAAPAEPESEPAPEVEQQKKSRRKVSKKKGNG